MNMEPKNQNQLSDDEIMKILKESLEKPETTNEEDRQPIVPPEITEVNIKKRGKVWEKKKEKEPKKKDGE